MMASEGVMLTNDDATSCKRYATSKGYWKDDYIQNFVRSVPPRKAPEINRGYFVRHYSMSSLVEKFLTLTECECQIISLGCGYDTMFWRLLQKELFPKHGYYEVDMKPVVQKKMHHIKSRQPLNQCLRDLKTENLYALHSQYYHLISGDITNVEELQNSLSGCGVRTEIPTLFLVECVFVYVKHESVATLLTYISQHYPTCMIVDYDPVNLNDRFGEVMKQNLRGRDCHLFGAHATLQSKVESYKQFGLVEAKLLSDVYKELPTDEKSRIEKIEFLDEVHLLIDLLDHYCVCIVRNDKSNIGLNDLTI